MTTYEPGTVAVATVRGVEGVRVLRTTPGGAPWWSVMPVEGTRLQNEADLTDVRPLVVLDPDDLDGCGASHVGGLVGLLREYLPKRASGYDKGDTILLGVIRLIEAQTRTPKPPEPTGLGAVVKDRKGAKWVRTYGVASQPDYQCWKPENYTDHRKRYSEIDAVEVLSSGVAS